MTRKIKIFKFCIFSVCLAWLLSICSFVYFYVNKQSPEEVKADVEDVDTEIALSLPKPMPDAPKASTQKVDPLEGLNAESGNILKDLDIVKNLFINYQLVFKRNPIGDGNADIMKSMMGDNPRQLVYVSEGHSALNASNELIDRWGTPFFFHIYSRDSLEIRSAGPDGIHWNDDDVIDALGETESNWSLASVPQFE